MIQPKSLALVPLLAAALLAGCNRDLTIPAEPLRGRVAGTVDTQGHLPPNWVNVILVAADGARRDQVAGEDGTFVFGDLIPGDYYIELDVPGFAPMVRPNITVRGGATYETGKLAPTWLEGTPEEATVTGKVVVNGDGDATGGQVEFYLQPLNQRVALAAVGMDGEYVQRVPPGAYRLKARHPLFVSAELNNVTLGKGEAVDLTQQPLAMDINPATITGTVLRERDGLEPVAAAGALVTLSNGDTTTTDDNGVFSLTGLAPHTQTVRFTLAGHHDEAPARSASLAPGETTTLEPVTLSLDRGTVLGEVELADGQPARDVTVVVSGTAYSAVAVPATDASAVGKFQLNGVPVGVYEIVATKTRYSRAAKASVTVTRDGVVNVGRLTLTVLQGDFTIADADATNTPGYTRTAAVILDLSGFGSPAAFRVSEDGTFSGVAFQSFTGASQPFTLDAGEPGLRQGTHVVHAQYRDAEGNVSPTFSATVIVDTTPPIANALTLNSGSGFTRTPSPFTLTLDAQEGTSDADVVSGLSRVILSESGTLTAGRLTGEVRDFRRTVSFTPSLLTDGVRDVHVQFLDHAGNASAVLHEQLVVDTVPPSGAIAVATGAGAEAGYTRQALVELSQSAATEPNGGHVLIQLANSTTALGTSVLQPVQAVSSWFLDPSTQGAKKVYARLQDAAGNTSEVLEAPILYDSIAPSPAAVSILQASPTRLTTVTLALTSEAQLSSTAAVTASEDLLFLDATTAGPYPFPGSAELPFPLSSGDGVKQIYVRFRDRAGNEAIGSAKITRDTTPPVVSFTLEGALRDGTASSSRTFSTGVKLQVSQSGATGYLVGGDALTSCPATGYTGITSSTIDHTLTGTGAVRTVSLCVIDDAGNTTGPVTRTIELDADAPTGCVASLSGRKVDGSAAPAGRTASPNVTVTLSGCLDTPAEMVLSNATLSCSASLNWVPFSASVAHVLAGPDGTNSVFGCVRDATRNMATVQAGTIVLDTVAPVGAVVSLDDGAAYVNGAQVTARGGRVASVSGSATGASEWALGETAAPADFTALAATNPQDFTFADDGTQTIYALFRDDVGNTSSVVSDTIVFDTSAPVASFTLEGTLKDGAPSAARTASLGVKLRISHTGGSHYFVGGAALAACPSSGYLELPTGDVDHVLTGSGTTRTVKLCVRDAAGNTVGPLTQTIDYDPDAPTGCVATLVGRKVDGTASPAEKTASPNVQVAIAGCAETPTEIALSNGSITCSPTAALTWMPFAASVAHVLAGPDGPNTVQGCVRDATRNVGPIGPDSITLDTVAPQGPTVSIDSGAAYVNAAQVTARGGHLATVTGSAVGASEWAIGTSATPSSFGALSAQDFEFAGDGEQTIYALFRDDVGNTTIAVSDTIVFDTLPPDAAKALLEVEPEGGGFTRDTEVVLQLLAPVDATRMQVATAGNVAACASGDFGAAAQVAVASRYDHVLPTGEGLKRVCVLFLDAAGNPSTPLSGTITLDTLAPNSCAIALAGFKADGTGAPAGKTASPKIEGLVSSCNETPLEMYVTGTAITCTQGISLPWSTFESNFTFLLEGLDGSKTVRGCVRDAAGNVGTLNHADITLDTTPPAAPSVIIDGNAEYVNEAQVAARGGTFAPVAGTATGSPTEWAVLDDPTATPTFVDYTVDNPVDFAFAGEGRQSVYAVFRDDVGNTSAMTTDLITFDTQGPDVSGATLTADVGGNGYVNSVSVAVSIVLDKEVVAEVDRMAVAQAGSTAGCVAGDLSAASAVPFSSTFTFLVDSAEGEKLLCAKVSDAAGNPSAFVPGGVRISPLPNTAKVVLDTIEPSVPEIVTPAAVRSVATGTVQTVDIRLPVTEVNFQRYERLGGQDRTWVTASTSQSTTSFSYQLYSDATRAAGFQNVLRLRARDLAGNTSEASVVITTDISPPSPVQLSKIWVTNGDGKATVRWKRSASTDVTAYRVYYGAASNTYNGFLADQGASPVEIPSNATNLTLSGITSGSPVFATVKAVDHAGNESVTAATPHNEVHLQPNRLSPNQFLTLSTGIQYTHKLTRYDDVLYAVGFTGSSSSASTRLAAIDLSRVVSPLMGGSIRDPEPAAPTVSYWDWSDSPNNDQAFRSGADFAVQGQFGYLAAGTKLRVFDLKNPLSPALISTVEFSPYTVWKVNVRGDRAILQTKNLATDAFSIRTLSLTSLFDSSAATFPAWAFPDNVGEVNYSSFSPPGGLTSSRHLAFSFTANGGNATTCNLSTFTQQGTASNEGITYASPVSSGNYVYVSHMMGFEVLDVRSLWTNASNDLADAPVVADVQAAGNGGFEVQGPFAVFTDTSSAGIRTLDLSDISAVSEAGQMTVDGISSPNQVAWYGHYLIVAGGGQIAIMEGATPSALREVARSPEGGAFQDVVGGLWFNGGKLMDLHEGVTPVELGGIAGDCNYGGARLGDRVLISEGNQLRLYETDWATDRDPATTAPAPAVVALGASVTRVHEIAAHGAHLVAVTSRADGTYVEVFDAREILDRSAALTAFTLDGDRKASVKISAEVATGGNYAQLSLYRGRAFVTLQTGVAATDGLYPVDLRAVLDDVAGGALVPQGFAAGVSVGARGVTAGGSHAYFTSNSYINVVDVSAALDDDAGTVVSNSSPKASFSAASPQALTLSGHYLVMLPVSGTLMVLDVSTPLVPKMLATMPFARSEWNCGVGGQSTYIRSKLAIYGPRIYVTHKQGSRIVDLE